MAATEVYFFKPISSVVLSDRSNTVKPKKFHTPASELLFNRYLAGDPQREQAYQDDVINAEIARKIYQLRTKAGITQQELAQRVGTSKSAICRLEDADYDGHSLSILKKIAAALGKRVEIRFLPAKRIA